MKKYWGYHLMLDCSNCNKKKIKSETNIRNFLEELLKVAKMKKLGDPVIENLQTGDEKLHGFSAVQLIHTSSITCHFMDLSGDAYIDLFSCKEFDIDAISECVESYFAPKRINKHFILRDTNL